MDELRGPNIQIVLHVKEGLGFGFLRTPFIVSGSLNGYMLETDPLMPSHAPIFDAELVWEADKRRFRSLRIQNVPVKVEVFTMGTQGRKNKVGYLLLSLLGAQPCPSNKIIDVKYAWHRLLGVGSEGKCCHPQLMLSLSIEDRTNTPTPRNELRMFHSNEIAYPTYSSSNQPTVRNMLLSLNEYLEESKKTASSPDLQPKLLCDEGLIMIGGGKQLFVLSFVIGAVENIDMLLPENVLPKDVDFHIKYSVFTHNIMTDRASATPSTVGVSAQFNQKTCLRLSAELATLARYFSECPHMVLRVCAKDNDIGICSMDLRKLIPTEDTAQFLSQFCNDDRALTIHERCYILRCDELAKGESRRPYVDVGMSLKYAGVKGNTQKPKSLSARSATQLKSCRKGEQIDKEVLDCKSGSCTNLDCDFGGVAYTNKSAKNTARYTNASGDAVLQTNDIADLIKKMCDSFAQSQEKLLESRLKPTTSDMQVQCDPEKDMPSEMGDASRNGSPKKLIISEERVDVIKIERSKCETCTCSDKERIKDVIPLADRERLMQRYVDELEEWKEKQQQLFRHQLKRKEEYHLDLLSREWTKKRIELEAKLTKGIEQCRNLAADLSSATDDFRLRGYRNTEREKKLLDAKKALEAHYTAKYQELREASQKMEADMNHQLKLKDMRIEEVEFKLRQTDKLVDDLQNNLKNNEKEAENKYSGLTKDQTASLIQELRCLEEKLDSAVQSKAFFKEQWGRAVRELHLNKLSTRKQMLTQLEQDRRQLGEMGLDTIEDKDETASNPVDIKKLRDDFYVDLLANTPALESHSIITTSGADGYDNMFEDLRNAPRNPMNERLNELIEKRDRLVQDENPNEDTLKQLNHDIRNMLLNCGT